MITTQQISKEANMKTSHSYEELQDLVHALSWNQAFGCYTRAGFEKMIWPQIWQRARWIVYFDLDGIHALNEKFGSYDPVDAMIKKVFENVRSTDYVAGQYKSGDEFLLCITEDALREPSDPQALVERLTIELQKHDLSATFAVVPVVSNNLVENVKPAIDQVYESKKQKPSRR